MTALRDSIVAELLKRAEVCRSMATPQNVGRDSLIDKATTYETSASIVTMEFNAAPEDTASPSRPSLFNSAAAMIARIVAEHPRCIAMAPSLPYATGKDADNALSVAATTVTRWVEARVDLIDEVTLSMTTPRLTATYGALTIGDLSIPVVMVTIVCDGARFMVAIEAVR